MLDSDGVADNIVASYFNKEGGVFVRASIVLELAAKMRADEHFGAVHPFQLSGHLGDPDRSDGAFSACEIRLPPLEAFGVLGDRARRRPVPVVGVRVEGQAHLTMEGLASVVLALNGALRGVLEKDFVGPLEVLQADALVFDFSGEEVRGTLVGNETMPVVALALAKARFLKGLGTFDEDTGSRVLRDTECFPYYLVLFSCVCL